MEKRIKPELLRKLLHLLLSTLLLLPLTPYYKSLFTIGNHQAFDPTLVTYAALTFVIAVINSVQIRVQNLETVIASIVSEHRKRLLDYASQSFEATPLSDFLKNMDKIMSKLEKQLLSLIDNVKRDYERRYGYISITFTLLSISLSYAIWREDTYVGILALALVDGVAGIITIIDTRSRKVFKHTITAYITSFLAFTFVLYIITRNMLLSLVTCLIALIIESISPEDNLTLPFITTTTFSILKNAL